MVCLCVLGNEGRVCSYVCISVFYVGTKADNVLSEGFGWHEYEAAVSKFLSQIPVGYAMRGSQLHVGESLVIQNVILFGFLQT